MFKTAGGKSLSAPRYCCGPHEHQDKKQSPGHHRCYHTNIKNCFNGIKDSKINTDILIFRLSRTG